VTAPRSRSVAHDKRAFTPVYAGYAHAFSASSFLPADAWARRHGLAFVWFGIVPGAHSPVEDGA